MGYSDSAQQKNPLGPLPKGSCASVYPASTATKYGDNAKPLDLGVPYFQKTYVRRLVCVNLDIHCKFRIYAIIWCLQFPTEKVNFLVYSLAIDVAIL